MSNCLFCPDIKKIRKFGSAVVYYNISDEKWKRAVYSAISSILEQIEEKAQEKEDEDVLFEMDDTYSMYKIESGILSIVENMLDDDDIDTLKKISEENGDSAESIADFVVSRIKPLFLKYANDISIGGKSIGHYLKEIDWGRVNSHVRSKTKGNSSSGVKEVMIVLSPPNKTLYPILPKPFLDKKPSEIEDSEIKEYCENRKKTKHQTTSPWAIVMWRWDGEREGVYHIAATNGIWREIGGWGNVSYRRLNSLISRLQYIYPRFAKFDVETRCNGDEECLQKTLKDISLSSVLNKGIPTIKTIEINNKNNIVDELKKGLNTPFDIKIFKQTAQSSSDSEISIYMSFPFDDYIEFLVEEKNIMEHLRDFSDEEYGNEDEYDEWDPNINKKGDKHKTEYTKEEIEKLIQRIQEERPFLEFHVRLLPLIRISDYDDELIMDQEYLKIKNEDIVDIIHSRKNILERIEEEMRSGRYGNDRWGCMCVSSPWGC